MSKSVSYHWHKLERQSAITTWAAAEPEEILFPGLARPMKDTVDYRFQNGWVNTGDLPCREALRRALPERVVDRPKGPFTQLASAGVETELDFSTFRHRPTLIRRAFQCNLKADAHAQLRFRIATCGGVRLWRDDAPVAIFEPFQRNRKEETDITFSIPTGETCLILMLEDLHERDTTNFFSLTFLEGSDIEVGLPPHVSADEAIETSLVLESLHFGSVFHDKGKVTLHAGRKSKHDVNIDLEGPTQFSRGGITQEPDAVRRSSIFIQSGSTKADAFDVDEATHGCQSLQLVAQAGGAKLSRALGTTIIKPGTPLVGSLSERKSVAATEIARAAGFEPPVATLLALRGENPARAAAIVNTTLITIEERHDCSDFSILPMLRLWRDASDTLSLDLRQRLRRAILGYRYWLSEPGDDVMWFWSENHVLCFHTAQLVAGALFPDEIFENSGRKGSDLAEEAYARLQRWFDAVDAHGLCEWNSAAYYPIDMLGLLTLHDMAPDLRDRAGGLLDRIFTMVALHTCGDVPAGSQGRCYEKELLAGPATELGSVAAIAFGAPFSPGYDRAAALFCLSDYVPPEGLHPLWRPPDDACLSARYTQGLGHAGRLSLWKSADIQLSTATVENAGEKGHQAHVIDVQAAAHPMARLWINHPGELKEWGDRRPSLLAGNSVMPHVAQHGSTAILLYDLERPWTDIAFTQLFAVKDAFSPPERVGDWRVFAAGQSRTAVWCSSELEEVTGTYAGSMWRAHAIRAGWVVTVAEPGETKAAFCQRLERARPDFSAQKLSLQTTTKEGTDFRANFGKPSRLNGQSADFSPLSPEPHVGWNGKPPEIWRPNATGS